MKKYMLYLFLSLLSKTCLLFAETNSIRVWEHTVNEPNKIFFDSLVQALEITKKEYGDYQLITSAEMGQERALRELAKKEESILDLGHFVATNERESLATPIRIPLLQGLLGYRLCLIKQGKQAKFSAVENKEQWISNKLTIGQHQHWPDTQILKSNGLTVQTSYKKKLLYHQLAKERFDCFARGANEISHELQENSDMGLAIESKLVLYYPFPVFFFVNKSNEALTARLKLGFTRLQEAGLLKQRFHDYYQADLDKLQLDKRTLITLQNSTLSQATINAVHKTNLAFMETYFKPVILETITQP